MSFRAVVMRDPTVLLCAFFGRYRRLPNATVRAWRRRGGHGAESIRDIAQRMSGDNAQKSTRIALRAGDWLFWRRDPWRQPDIRGMRLIGVRLCCDV